MYPTDDIVQTEDPSKDEIAKIKSTLKLIEKRRKKWQYAWANDLLRDEEFSELMREESEKENDLKSTLNKLKPNENIRLDNNELKEIIQNIKLNWNTLNDEEKRCLCKSSSNESLWIEQALLIHIS